jgi:hypothetical protein
MEPEGSLIRSQESVTGSHPEPDISSPQFPPYFPRINCNIIFPTTPMSSLWSLPFSFFDQNFERISHLSNSCCMPTHLILPDLITLVVVVGQAYNMYIQLLMIIFPCIQNIVTRMALGPTQPPIQWVPGALSLGVKRPGPEADRSPPYSTDVREWV